MDEKFYTPQEVAELLGVHLQTVRKWYRNGELSCYKVGHVRISESQLAAFLERRQQSGGSQSNSTTTGGAAGSQTDGSGDALQSMDSLLDF